MRNQNKKDICALVNSALEIEAENSHGETAKKDREELGKRGIEFAKADEERNKGGGKTSWGKELPDYESFWVRYASLV